MWLCASLKPGTAQRPARSRCAVASWQGILDKAPVPDRDDSVADHADGFDLWLRGIHRQNRPVAHEQHIGHGSCLPPAGICAPDTSLSGPGSIQPAPREAATAYQPAHSRVQACTTTPVSPTRRAPRMSPLARCRPVAASSPPLSRSASASTRAAARSTRPIAMDRRRPFPIGQPTLQAGEPTRCPRRANRTRVREIPCRLSRHSSPSALLRVD